MKEKIMKLTSPRTRNFWGNDTPKQKLGFVLAMIGMPIVVLWVIFIGAPRLEAFLTAPIGFKPHPNNIFDWVAAAGLLAVWFGLKWLR